MEYEASESKSRSFVEEIEKETTDFVLVGLTGRYSVEASDVARFLQGEGFRNSPIQLAPCSCGGFESSELRDYCIAERYIRERWVPFAGVSVSDVMLSFLLDEAEAGEGAYEGIYKFGIGDLDENSKSIIEELEQSFESAKGCLRENSAKYVLRINESLTKRFADDVYRPTEDEVRRATERLVGGISDFDGLQAMWKQTLGRIERSDFSSFDTVVMCFGVIPFLAESFEGKLNEGRSQDRFSLVFQRLGNYIRAYGKAYPTGPTVSGECLFDLPKRVDQFCMVLRHYCQAASSLCPTGSSGGGMASQVNPVVIVISSFKSIFEAYYFRMKYSSFYLVAVSGDLGQREIRRSLQLGPFDVESIVSLGEDLSRSKKAFSKFLGQYAEARGSEWVLKERSRLPSDGLTEVQYEFCRSTFQCDGLRKDCYEKKLAPFILQDVMTCIENADVFVTRDMSLGDISGDGRLIRDMARFLVLVMHPGLLKPTKIERCMQIAMTAKLNSGCLSRQVGAVVTDAEYNILSLGWNDVSCGAVSCSQRSVSDIASQHDGSAYSDFEKRDPLFRSYINDVHTQMREMGASGVLRGLPVSYCFKDIYQDIIGERDQIHTRALHGEERALAACGNGLAKDGCLFTTSSPCELCAKKVKEAGIKKIYYIEQYPGISHAHVIDDGPYESRAQYLFFTGCVGLAYTKLYTPLLPYKDELEALGLSPKALRRAALEKRREASESIAGEKR